MSRSTQTFGAIHISKKGFIDAGDNIIKKVKNPINNKDAANKEYVNRFNNIGDIKMSIQSSDFYGWLKCDGRSLSRTIYPDLFAIIGTTFGSTDGNSFNLPDCRGRVIGTIGQGTGLTNRTFGSTTGEESHTLTINEMPSHNHNITDNGHTHNGTTSSSGDHTHTSNANGGQGGLGLVTANGSNTETDVDSSGGELNLWTTPYALTIDSSGSHTHSFTTGSSITGISINNNGGGNSFNVMQPTIFLGNVFIYSGVEN